MKMAGNTPKVYDLFHPTPVPLKELAAIAVSLQIWRSELKKFRTNGLTEEKFDASRHGSRISLDTHLPDLPTEIRDMIRGYVEKLGLSIDDWVSDHCRKVIADNTNSRDDFYYVLKYFDDLVCDYDGTLHYVRTAKRWMQCTSNMFGLNGKFSLACLYCFEDVIKEIWPFVSKNTVWDNIECDRNPILYYWICYLRNDLGKIKNRRGDSVYETLFCLIGKDKPCLRPAVDYFWDRIPFAGRMRPAKKVMKYRFRSFVRFLLPKLDNQLLQKIVNYNGVDLVHILFRDEKYDEQAVITTWLYVRNRLNKDMFSYLVQKIFETELLYVSDDFWGKARDDDSLAYLAREIWNNAPRNLKLSTIREIISDSQMFEGMAEGLDCDPDPKNADFLLTVIADAAIEDRKNLFWVRNWHHLIALYSGTDLQQMMKLCFENDDEIVQFKEKVIAVSKYVSGHCHKLLDYSHFNKLNDFISFLYPETQSAIDFKRKILKKVYLLQDFTEENALASSKKLRNRFFKLLNRAEFDELNDFLSFLWPEMREPRIFKQRLLQLAFLGQDCQLGGSLMDKIEKFNEFIDDTFNTIELSNDFKNQLASSPSIQDRLARFAHSSYNSEKIWKFVDTFVLQEETLMQIKMRTRDALKEHFSKTNTSSKFELRLRFSFDFPSGKFLLWCFGNDEEVAKFKLSIGYKPKDSSDSMSADSDSEDVPNVLKSIF
ncbi:uncharacterized protein LOC135848305 [Planococcus citri]|uniref:uncharacterized protein LOC135848305 n=1 Tax=Planococcus citri TaxID=170843 RepID=UPI0031F79C8B